MTSADAPCPPARMVRCGRAAAWAAYLAILWLGLLVMPVAVPLSSLDRSWYAVLAHDWREAVQVGRDSVFTYGPLGWLLTPAQGFDADLFTIKVIAMVVAMLAVAVLLTTFVRRMPAVSSRVGAALLVLYLVPVVQDSVYVLAILAGTTLVLSRDNMPLVAALLVSALLAVVGLIKFTHLAVAVPCLAGLITAASRQRSWRAAAAIAGGWLTTSVIAWMLAGQSLTGIAGYLQSSAQIASGYHDVMGTRGPGSQLALGIVCLLLLGCLCAHTVLARPRSFARAVIGAVVLALVLGGWKAGFVRQDGGHVRIFFGLASLAPFALLPLAKWNGPTLRWYGVGTIAVVVFAITGIEQSRSEHDGSLAQTPGLLWNRLSDNVHALAAPRRFAADQAEQWRTLAAITPLPETRRALGGGHVDAFGHEQGILLANSLPLRHRPVFQSYSAYTPELQEMNAACLEAPDGPGHVLFKLQPLDGYYPTVADSQTLLTLLAGYAPVLEESGFLLLRRSVPARGRADLARRTVWAGSSDLTSWIEVKGTPGSMHLLSLDVDYSVPGRLQGLVLRPPRLFLEVRLDDAETMRYRIAPAIVRAPFLLDPLVRSTQEFHALCRGGALPRVTAFRVVNSAGKAAGFADRIGVHLLAIAAR